MRRTNQRFHKRLKVREGIEERLIHAEKLNELLARSSNVQAHINLELRGKYNTMERKVLKIYQTIKDLKDADTCEVSDHQVYVMEEIA